MITTVVLNPAIDKIYFVDDFQVGKMFRVSETVRSAGGKGINVARVANILGEKVSSIGFKGGEAGSWLQAQLIKQGVCTGFIEVEGESRTNNNIIDKVNKTETEVLEAGPYITPKDIDRFLAVYEEVLKNTKVLVCTGGLPQGVPEDIYKTLIDMARLHDVITILDASGKVLEEGMKARPYVIKPNLRELGSLAGKELKDIDDILKVSRGIAAAGIEVVTVSMGDRGALMVTRDTCLWARVPAVDIVNTIGSGDSMVAGFAAGLSRGYSLKETLKLAAACSVSNTQFVEIGVVDKTAVSELENKIEILEVGHKI
ncbi:MAG: 1-phosphofructokinase [Bacillota bacterium]